MPQNIQMYSRFACTCRSAGSSWVCVCLCCCCLAAMLALRTHAIECYDSECYVEKYGDDKCQDEHYNPLRWALPQQHNLSRSCCVCGLWIRFLAEPHFILLSFISPVSSIFQILVGSKGVGELPIFNFNCVREFT